MEANADPSFPPKQETMEGVNRRLADENGMITCRVVMRVQLLAAVIKTLKLPTETPVVVPVNKPPPMGVAMFPVVTVALLTWLTNVHV